MTVECEARLNDELDHSLIETKCGFEMTGKSIHSMCKHTQKNTHALKTNGTKREHDRHDGYYCQLIELKSIFVGINCSDKIVAICSG